MSYDRCRDFITLRLKQTVKLNMVCARSVSMSPLYPYLPFFRLRHTTPPVRTMVTPKFLGVSLPARASLICVATTSTTSLVTASQASPRLCPCTCSAARLWRSRTELSVAWRDSSTCTCQRTTLLPSAQMHLKVEVFAVIQLLLHVSV